MPRDDAHTLRRAAFIVTARQSNKLMTRLLVRLLFRVARQIEREHPPTSPVRWSGQDQRDSGAPRVLRDIGVSRVTYHGGGR
jgi:hypothetical protein